MGWIMFLFGFLGKAEGDNVIISNNQKIIVPRFQKKNIDYQVRHYTDTNMHYMQQS